MAYTLQALIGDEFVIRTAVPSDGVVVRLPQGKAMVPLSERMRQNRDIPLLPLTDEGVAVVPESISSVAESIARSGMVAYVEAEFFGGTGTQACVTWDVTGNASQPLVEGNAINAALKFLGVCKEDHHDEFDALGLGRHRHTDDWEKLAEPSPLHATTLGEPLELSTIKGLVKTELQKGETFTNNHGITPANVRDFLVEPFAVLTDPDDLETRPRMMWVVLREGLAFASAYAIVYDPPTRTWGVAEYVGDSRYTLVASASSLAQALNAM